MSDDPLTQLFASAPFDAIDPPALAATARALKRADRAREKKAATDKPLRSKYVALICAVPDGDCARDFNAAASELGVRVSRIEPEAAWLQGKLDDAPETARMLGRLYDAIDCEEVPEGFARELRQAVGIPVFDGLARKDHPLTGMLPQLSDDGRSVDAADQRYLVQAVLMHALR